MAGPRSTGSRIAVYIQIVFFTSLYVVTLVGGILALTRGYLTPYFEWIDTIGIWGNILLVLSFIPASLPFLMGYTPLTLASGFIYGLWVGSLTSEIGAVVGGCVAFVLTRRYARDRILRMLEAKPQFNAFMRAVDRHGFVIVALLRCAPIPFGVQNGAFAVSSISFRKYTIATIVGLIPEQIMFTYFGTTLKSLADVMKGEQSMDRVQGYILYSQCAIAAAVFIFLAFLGRRAMQMTEPSLDLQLEAVLLETAADDEVEPLVVRRPKRRTGNDADD
eukprot:c48000_g1_i1.p1 GENE.c48000_g1_i1~~c48000_g1_i1.p1  ORF type:complete len:276 (+),score=51.61 c48000_g1_i1:130-957(+)